MRNYSRKQNRKPDFFYVSIVIFVLFALLTSTFYFFWNRYSPPTAFAFAKMEGAPAIPTMTLFGSFNEILGAGMPGFTSVLQKSAPVKIEAEISAGQGVRTAVLLFTGIDVEDIRSILQKEIPLLVSLKNPATPTVSAVNMPNFPKFDFSLSGSEGKPLVGIYHTHTSEAFIPSSGHAHSPGGQRGDIVQVGSVLAKRLEQNNIGVVQSLAVHDYPSFMKAYNLSEATVQKLTSDNPSLQMIFDIHRDAQKKENVTAVVNGVQAARILIIVGMGRPDLVQPHWQQNHAFAKLIEAKLNASYPGLCRGIELVDWRYNQHLHPRALLLEVGSEESSMEEATRSMEMLGDVLTEIINQGTKP